MITTIIFAEKLFSFIIVVYLILDWYTLFFNFYFYTGVTHYLMLFYGAIFSIIIDSIIFLKDPNIDKSLCI